MSNATSECQHGRFSDRCVTCLNEKLGLVKKALREAILNKSRTTRRTIDADSAGNIYEIDWTGQVKEWAALCDLDLSKYEAVLDQL